MFSLSQASIHRSRTPSGLVAQHRAHHHQNHPSHSTRPPVEGYGNAAQNVIGQHQQIHHQNRLHPAMARVQTSDGAEHMNNGSPNRGQLVWTNNGRPLPQSGIAVRIPMPQRQQHPLQYVPGNQNPAAREQQRAVHPQHLQRTLHIPGQSSQSEAQPNFGPIRHDTNHHQSATDHHNLPPLLPQNAHQYVAISNAASAQPKTNFNNISKTATNLLHDIYEKHLLAQTRFNVTTGAISEQPAAPATVSTAISPNAAVKTNFNFNSLCKQQQLQLMSRQQKWVVANSGGGAAGRVVGGTSAANAPPEAGGGGGGAGGGVDEGGGVEMMIKNNLRQRVPRKISESVSLKLQRSLNEKQMALAASSALRRRPIGTSATAAATPAVSCGGGGGGSGALQEAIYVQHAKTNGNSVYCDLQPSKQYAGEAVLVEGGTQLAHVGGAHHQHGQDGDINGKISGRTEAVGGNIYVAASSSSSAVDDSRSISGGLSALHVPAALMSSALGAAVPTPTTATTSNRSNAVAAATHSAFVHRNSKINIVLETAQAMAAAAYFARFVQIYISFALCVSGACVCVRG